MILVILILVIVILIILARSKANNKQFIQNTKGIDYPVILSDGNAVNARIDISYLVVEPKKVEKTIWSSLQYDAMTILDICFQNQSIIIVN